MMHVFNVNLIQGQSILRVCCMHHIKQNTGYDPAPSVWKTDMQPLTPILLILGFKINFCALPTELHSLKEKD